MLGPAIKTKLGTLCNNHVYPFTANNNGLPAIYYIVRMIPNNASNGKTSPKWEVVIITELKHYSDTWAFSAQVQKVLEDMGAAHETVNEITFQSFKMTDARDEFELITENYGQRLTFSVMTRPI